MCHGKKKGENYRPKHRQGRKGRHWVYKRPRPSGNYISDEHTALCPACAVLLCVAFRVSGISDTSEQTEDVSKDREVELGPVRQGCHRWLMEPLAQRGLSPGAQASQLRDWTCSHPCSKMPLPSHPFTPHSLSYSQDWSSSLTRL